MAGNHGRRNARVGSHTRRVWRNPGDGVPPEHGARVSMGATDLRGPDGCSSPGSVPGSARSCSRLRRLFLRTIYRYKFRSMIRSEPLEHPTSLYGQNIQCHLQLGDRLADFWMRPDLLFQRLQNLVGTLNMCFCFSRIFPGIAFTLPFHDHSPPVCLKSLQHFPRISSASKEWRGRQDLESAASAVTAKPLLVTN